MSVTIDH